MMTGSDPHFFTTVHYSPPLNSCGHVLLCIYCTRTWFVFHDFLSITDKRNGRILETEESPGFRLEVDSVETSQRNVTTTKLLQKYQNVSA
jgi:hypothetical protein